MENKDMMMDGKFDEKKNLIVNYLPSSLSQDDVKLLFCRIGPVANCKLVRNYETGQSLGYAFIEYPTEQLTLDAISQLDGLQMEEKVLKVSYARQSSPEIKQSNVYVAGLPENLKEDQLFQLFSPFGKVITHKLLLNSDSTSRGVGFVRYALKSEAQSAIDSMSGKKLEGAKTPLTVKIAIPPVSKQQNSLLAAMQTNVLAGGIGATSANISMIKGGVRYNPLAPSNQAVINSSSMINQQISTIDSLGSTASLQGYSSASTASNNSLVVQSPVTQVFSIYVFGLQAIHSELTLYELFAPFGAVVNVKLIRDLTKEEKPCKGFGFVNFKKYEDAYTAVGMMNNRPFEGRNLQVSFKQSKHGSIAGSPLSQTSSLLQQQQQQHHQQSIQQHQSPFTSSQMATFPIKYQQY